MVIDTSAIVAILGNEPEAERLERALVTDRIRLVPATCVLEARIVLVARYGEHALPEIELWLRTIEATIIAVDAELIDMATRSWLTFGKGRHPAALNFADCVSYALAKRSREPLLFVGDDFSKTDVTTA